MIDLRDYLYESLVLEAGKMNATDMEVMICFAHNKMSGLIEDDEKNLLYCTNDKPTNSEKNIIKIYNQDPDRYNAMVKTLSDIGKLRKLDNEENPTAEWVKMGTVEKSKEGTTEAAKPNNNTPKTDIISVDGVKISVKKGDKGGAQLCSAKLPEAKATLMSGYDMLDKDGKELLEKFLDTKNWYSKSGLPKYVSDILKDDSLKDTDIYKELEEAKNANVAAQKILDELVSNSGFADAVIYEAATGEIKFGEDSNSCANSFFTWDDKRPETSKFWPDVKTYLNTFGRHFTIDLVDVDPAELDVKHKGITFYANFKSSGGKTKSTYTCFRITMK